MRLSKIGGIALRFWEDIPNHSVNAGLDAFVIMPNHLHGIVTIKAPAGSTTTGKNGGPGTHSRGSRDVACNVSTNDSGRLTYPPKPGSLGAVVQISRHRVVQYERLHDFRLAAAIL